MAFDFSNLKKQPAKQQAPQQPAGNQFGEYADFIVDDMGGVNDVDNDIDIFEAPTIGTTPPATTPRGSSHAAPSNTVTKVRIMKPRVFEDARNIADKLKEGYIISMSLECVEAKEEVKNIMTFLAGVVYALRADIVSVSDQVWLLYPRNLVQLTEDGKDAQ